MDTRRLNTSEVIAEGILDKPASITGIPEDRPKISYDLWEWPIKQTREELHAALIQNTVIDCSEYYGIPVIWRERDIYKGILLQYRSVTESHTFETPDEALDWFLDTAQACEG